MQSSGGNLVQKGLKEMVIVLVDEDDIGLGAPKGSSRGHSSKSAAYDHDTRFFEVHALQL
jgi:hypothetical protein